MALLSRLGICLIYTAVSMGTSILPVLSINYIASLSSSIIDDFCQAGCLLDYGECKGILVINL
jgi:hypothetical protein